MYYIILQGEVEHMEDTMALLLTVRFMNLSVIMHYCGHISLLNHLLNHPHAFTLRETYALVDLLTIAGGLPSSNSMFSSAGGPGTNGTALRCLVVHHISHITELLLKHFYLLL